MDQSRLDELIDKYASGEITTEEWQELMEWYRSAEVGAIEWPSDKPDERDQLQQRMLLRLQNQIQFVPRKVFRLRAWHVAASLIIVVSSYWIARQYLGLTRGPSFVTTKNPSGKIQAILLPDGSKVWLNAASSIRYSPAFDKGGADRREVWLEGEGFFDVVANPAHSFVVHSGSLTTTVLGTSFDVKSYPDESEAAVTVIHGKVGVRDSVRELDVLTTASQLRVDTRNGRSTRSMIDTNQVMGWREGKLQFPGQTMEEIAASLGRWYDVRFVFANPAINRCRYYLNFENTISLQQMLEALKVATDLDFREDDTNHTVTISGTGCK
jgi:ferric-dicitrate binding protein FerR (iron transport regulator)